MQFKPFNYACSNNFGHHCIITKYIVWGEKKGGVTTKGWRILQKQAEGWCLEVDKGTKHQVVHGRLWFSTCLWKASHQLQTHTLSLPSSLFPLCVRGEFCFLFDPLKGMWSLYLPIPKKRWRRAKRKKILTLTTQLWERRLRMKRRRELREKLKSVQTGFWQWKTDGWKS